MILETHGKEIVAFIVPFIAWTLNTFFKSKAKLLIAKPHSFTFLVLEPLHDSDGKEISKN
jgi:hypothetical protein